MNGLASLLVGLAGPMAKQVLIALGIGFVTYAGLDLAISAAFDAVKGNLSQIAGSSAAILARAGLFSAFSILAGGIMAGVSMVMLKRLGKIA